jgi:hypothetical protein
MDDDSFFGMVALLYNLNNFHLEKLSHAEAADTVIIGSTMFRKAG